MRWLLPYRRKDEVGRNKGSGFLCRRLWPGMRERRWPKVLHTRKEDMKKVSAHRRYVRKA